MTAGKEVYIVSGSHGEYSDYETWNVAAFTDGVVADAFVTVLRIKLSEALETNRETDLIRADLTGEWFAGRLDSKPELPQRIEHLAEDPSGRGVYSGVYYSVELVPLNPPFDGAALGRRT